MKEFDTSIGGFQGQYPTTQWSFVMNAKDRSSPECVERMNRLVSKYWKPIYRAIRLGWGKSNDDAKDLTQGFLFSLLERKFWLDVHPDKGRLRHYLKAALKHYLLNDQRDSQRQKRGGGQTLLSIDALQEADQDLDLSATGTPDDVFDREWASDLLERAAQELEKDLADSGKGKYYDVFRLHDLEPGADDPPSYQEIAARLGLSLNEVRNYLSYARLEMRRKVVSLISEYALNENEVFQELQELLGGPE